MTNAVKGTLDRLVAVLGLIALSPLLAACSLAVLATMGRPILFRQARVGHRGVTFVLLKFRTMREGYATDGFPLPDAERLTPFGCFLRRTSLDELPQLWNVVRGELSLVGPRPLLVEYLPLYSPEQARRHDAMPGITGWAQVNGRNAVGWADRLAMDTWYVDNRSLALDFRILLMTVDRVVSGAGVSGEGVATVSKFRGNACETP